MFGLKNGSVLTNISQELLGPGINVLGAKYSWLYMRFLFPLHRKFPENVLMSGWWHMEGVMVVGLWVLCFCCDVGYVSPAFLKLFLCVQLRQLHRSFHRRRTRSLQIANAKVFKRAWTLMPVHLSYVPPHPPTVFFPRESLRSGGEAFQNPD